MSETNKKNYFDYGLLFIIFLFMIVSCIGIYSAQKDSTYHENFVIKQFIWYVVGLSISIVIYYFDFEQIKKLSLYVYLAGNFTLVVLHFSPDSIAPVTKGAKAWFNLPGIGSIQPSEFMKVFLILYLARVIANHNERYYNRTIKSDIYLISKLIIVTIIPIGLILLQNDAGTAMVITIIMIGMLFVSGVSWKLISTLAALGISILSILVLIYIYNPDLLLHFLSQYQIDRINSWLDPFTFSQGIGYQLANSILAIGSGLTFGKGFYKSEVPVPEAHSDFFFTKIGEEFGFIGGSIVISMYFILIYKIMVIVFQNKGQYETFIGAGVISMLTFHIFENIGMVMGLVPITGIPLPLLSYGGSSILSTLLALGFILNISAKTKKFMFGSDR
ncbi:rod shape-determining protein RodA [Heyndrickxia sporothermodurans]|uniref:FtsW/RodA/SpoVE family cell cycle protein n=1 Tax=Heyndrickxia sporothermodurans TaxID=46224 RepID=UPI002DB7B0AA|nr:FtsW/RodA/SpoVE family cell cycle protein [Heyndrickxia sporothermodurans]MEB6551124.1 rod shape-determining protein RodA [Heyndrickxia sporothermodurans]